MKKFFSYFLRTLGAGFVFYGRYSASIYCDCVDYWYYIPYDQGE